MPSPENLSRRAASSAPTAPFNENHVDNATYNSLYSEAIATLEAAKQRELVHEMQKIDWNEGGYIIPYFTPFIDAHGSNVHGVLPAKELPITNFQFKYFWLD